MGCKEPATGIVLPSSELEEIAFQFFSVHDELSRFLTYLTIAVSPGIADSGYINSIDLVNHLNAANRSMKYLRKEIKAIKNRQWLFMGVRIVVSVLFGGVGGFLSRWLWGRRTTKPGSS